MISYSEDGRKPFHTSCIEVRFLRGQATDTLKPEKQLWIDDRLAGRTSVAIRWRYDKFWTDNRLHHTPELAALIPPAHSPRNILNALNDDCLRNILERCVNNDSAALCEVVQVCERIQYIAQEIIRRTSILSLQTGRVPLPVTENFFRMNGQWMTDVRIGDDAADVTIGIIEKYCPNLESFRCSITHQQSFKELRLLAQRIKALHIDWHFISPIIDCMSGAFNQYSNLEVLSIHNTSKRSLCFPTSKMPKLIELRLRNVRVYDEKMFTRFFEQNDQLKTLWLQNVLIGIGLEAICHLLPNLRALRISSTPSVALR